MCRFGVWEDSTEGGLREPTGRAPTSTCWVGVDTGRHGTTEVRSLWRVNPGAKRRFPHGARGGQHRLGQVTRASEALGCQGACLNGKLQLGELAYAQLPPKFGGGVGRLCRWLYGMSTARSALADVCAPRLATIGFQRGLAAPMVFWHPVSGSRLVVWGVRETTLPSSVQAGTSASWSRTCRRGTMSRSGASPASRAAARSPS